MSEPQYNYKDFFVNDKHIDLFNQSICCNTIGTVKDSSATEKSML